MMKKFLLLNFALLYIVYAQNTITLTSPNGGEKWQTGSNHNITWTSTGVIADVKIEYTTDGTSWTQLVASTINTGAYAWNSIALPAGTTYKIRVSDVLDNNVSDASNNNFSLLSLAITSPNGGEKWQVGSTHTITWAASSGITNVKLEYYNGAAWNDIAASVTAATGTYSWVVPNAPSNQVKIRVTDTSDPTITDQSDADFTVASLSVTSPNGSNYLQAGKIATIQWSASAHIGNVKLELTLDNGATWTNIEANLPVAPNTYAWTVPNTPSTGTRIRVSDVSNSTISDISDASFTITSLSVSSPNGGERFLTGATKQITWIASNITNVKIEYSPDGGATFPTVISASTAASAGSFNWTIAAGTTTQGLIKISDADHGGIDDQSNAVFTISDLSITAPTGASIWKAGTNQNITWTSTNIAQVKIDYSVDNGTSWIGIATNINAALGTYAWSVPNNPSFQTKIRVSDQSFQENYKVSTGFELEPTPAITVTSPNGTENWQENSVHAITWTATYNIANVTIELSTDGGTTYPTTLLASIAASTGTWNWTVPSTFSNNCKIRVASVADAAINDASNNTFTISRLVLNTPNGGEKIQGGKPYNITWTYQNINNVKLEYTTDGTTWNLIANNIQASLGTYAWTVPNTASTTVKVRISNSSVSEINDVSAANFTIATLAVTSPNGGENWLANSLQNITWSSQNITNVKIEYSTDGGTTYPNTIIASTAAAAGTYSWTTPNTFLTTYKVRVSDAADATINDASDNNFTVSYLELTAPITAVNWKVGTTQSITWIASAAVTNIKLDYTINNGASWINIAPSIVASVGTYSWLVPNTPSGNCKIRVSNVSNTEIKSESPIVFTISKSLDLTSPDGGEEWEVGSTRNITWTRDVLVTNIKIEYSTDSGTSWNVINNFVNATLLTYTWTVPNAISNNCLIRLTDVNNSSNTDQSTSTFKIVANPLITITRPNGGESFETGAQENITWTSNNVQYVKLEYTVNNGASWILIKSNEVSDGSYTWTVPNMTSAQCKVRITNENNASVYDISDDKFTIIPRVTVTAPNGGENLPVASSYNITWTSLNTANVKIEYSSDNGSNWNVIVASTAAAAGTYSWTTPNVPSSQYLIRISDATKPEIYDLSDNNFTVSSKITVTRPNGNESWAVGSLQSITWTSTNVTNVSISYSTDNGINWSSVTASTAAAAGTYNWTVPNTPSNKVKIKIADAANSSAYDESNSPFTISNLTLTKPNGAENYAIGSTQTITWTSTNITNVKLEYSINNETSWQLISASVPSSGLYYWEIPNTPSTQCKVRISDVDNPGTYDVSNAIFTISESPYIKVTYPNSRLEFKVGNTETIKWESSNVSNVKIEYSINGGNAWTPIVGSVSSTGNYNWVVPDVLTTQGRIRVSDISRTSIFDDSDSSFTITKNPQIAVTDPNGGESLNAGSTYPIKWTSSNIEKVNIDYSINNGASWTSIVSALPSTGNYSWIVPGVSSEQCLIKISDNTRPDVYDVSDSIFTITSKITIISPNGGERWLAGSEQNITWTSTNVTNIKIQYTADNGITWNQIVASTAAAAGTYKWTLPNSTGTNYKIKISDAANSNIYDMSDNVFIVSGLTITKPNGGESFIVGTQQSITWTSTNINDIKIEYTSNGGTLWNLISPSFPAATGTYSWLVPDAVSTQCKVRITDLSNTSTIDVSDANFSISKSASITVTAPNGGESINSGNSYSVKWTSENVEKVKIEYSIDKGTSWILIATNIPSTGLYSWLVPSIASEQCLIKISDSVRPEIYDQSNSIFSITSKILVKTPNGGESWQAGSEQLITWTSTGINNVAIHYTIDNGISWTQISASVSGALGYYKWVLPSTGGNNYKIRVSDATNTNVNDVSDDKFTITTLTLTKPNGNENYAVNSQQLITWSSTYISSVKIEYSINNGTNWIVIESNYPSTGFYYWTVPNIISTQCKVRISDYNNLVTTDMSDNTFIIGQLPYVKVLYPNKRVEFKTGTVEVIKWESSNVNNVKLEYSINSGNTWDIITSSTASTGSYNWTVPSVTSEQCKIRITDVLRSDIYDNSDSNFVIIKNPVIKLTAPNGGETVNAGSVYSIKWTSENIEKVKIEFSVNGGVSWNLITSSIPSSGTYSWLVPNQATTQAKIRITDVLHSNVMDESDANFKINSSSKLTLKSPNGDENLRVGSAYTILWTSELISNVKIEYSIDNGTSWDVVVPSTPSIGGYTWNIPNTPSYQCLLKISDVTDPTIYDLSDKIFSISKLELITPIDTEVLLAGSECNITWNSGGISNLKIEYSSNNGTSWNTIISSVSASLNNYRWTLPANAINECIVRISDVNKATVYDQNDKPFAIKQIIVLYPAENEVFNPGENQDIQWRSYNVANVRIEYSISSGSWWTNIATKIPASVNSYTWKIPNNPSSTCLVRISDVVKPAEIYAVSKSTFTINPPVDVQENGVPGKFELMQNYPNPFNPVTTIRYKVPHSTFVTIKVFDMLGNEIKTLVNGYTNPGTHEVRFDAERLSSGVYIYRMQTDKFTDTKKLLLLK